MFEYCPFFSLDKFFEISDAIAEDNTLASVRGYVVNFFSYKDCAIESVLLGDICNFLAHSLCNSARLNNKGAFFLIFSFSI